MIARDDPPVLTVTAPLDNAYSAVLSVQASCRTAGLAFSRRDLTGYQSPQIWARKPLGRGGGRDQRPPPLMPPSVHTVEAVGPDGTLLFNGPLQRFVRRSDGTQVPVGPTFGQAFEREGKLVILYGPNVIDIR